LVSGISNWGAAALLAAIAILKPDVGHLMLPFLRPSFAERLLEAVFSAGAVASDATGSPPAPRPYVDGLSWPSLAGTYQEIHQVCERTLALAPTG
jgi:hypothetical protein